jgi:hypothetical protein
MYWNEDEVGVHIVILKHRVQADVRNLCLHLMTSLVLVGTARELVYLCVVSIIIKHVVIRRA